MREVHIGAEAKLLSQIAIPNASCLEMCFPFHRQAIIAHITSTNGCNCTIKRRSNKEVTHLSR